MLVGSVRQILAGQGVDPSILSDSGSIDGANLLSIAFDQVEIRTAATPTVKFSLAGPTDPQTDALLRELQPAVILTGRAGTAKISPYGVPGGVSDVFKSAGVQIGIGALLAIAAAVLIVRAL